MSVEKYKPEFGEGKIRHEPKPFAQISNTELSFDTYLATKHGVDTAVFFSYLNNFIYMTKDLTTLEDLKNALPFWGESYIAMLTERLIELKLIQGLKL